MKANTKYNSILNELEVMISGMKHNSKLPPIRHLMQSLNVSQSPLDNALRLLEQRGQIIRIHGSGIYVNQRTGKPRTGTIGLVVTSIGDHFSSRVIKGIEEQLSDAGYRLLLCNSHRDLDKELQMLRSLNGKIDALILFPDTVHSVNPEYLNYFKEFSKKNNIPILTVNNPLFGVRSGYVAFNDFSCMREPTRKELLAHPELPFFFLGAMGRYGSLGRHMGFNSVLNHVERTQNVYYLNAEKGAAPDFTAVLNMIVNAGVGRNGAVFINSFPPALPLLLGFLHEHNIKIPDQARIVSVVEDDYRNYVHDPITAVVKLDVDLGKMAAKLILKAIRSDSAEIGTHVLNMVTNYSAN